ncbi:MAG: hypothetical protein LIO85_06145 [Rikenellaceae bacterium]|nr:hypothetical protein [Rikenellaceae bacterium]
MKNSFFICSIVMLLGLGACSNDDSSMYGKLQIRYGDPYQYATWTPGTLYLYSMDNTDVPLKEIVTTDHKTVKLDLLTGNYILKGETEGEEFELVFQILPDKTTKLYHHRSTLVMDNKKLAHLYPVHRTDRMLAAS